MLPKSDASEISDKNMSNADNDIPQWKKDLIARLRSQNKRTATAGRQEQQLCSQRPSTQLGRSVQQPKPGEAVASGEKCKAMVQERCWDWAPERPVNGACDSEEDLHYGPGIVSKLKERYLSLAQRETTKTRPTILRKATSLENLLDDVPTVNNATEPVRLFQTRLNGNADPRNVVPNRYRNKREPELKRARSVEAISRSEEPELESKPKRESMHEDMLITEGSDKPKIIDMLENTEPKTFSRRINRPKRIAPVMNEKEKPPADVVKQAKMIFERRPEQRTKQPAQTGEVAAKVATYKNIIVQQKPNKKPALKVKPTLSEKPKMNGARVKNKQVPKTCPIETIPSVDIPPATKSPESLPSPIPDISRIDFKSGDESGTISTNLSETPDLIITSSPLPAVNSPSFRIAATENFIKEEIRLASNERTKSPPVAEDKHSVIIAKINDHYVHKNHVPSTINQHQINILTPPTQPLKVEINGVEGKKKDNENKSPTKTKTLTTVEIEKNLINTAKTLEQPKAAIKSVEEVTLVKVVKVKKPSREVENSVVFDFRDRKDVPDYVHNDGIRRTAVLEKPKVGEGGITLLPSFSNEDEELLRSLEGPPSPCDVTFINDNILIDGKSSLSQKTKRAKMRISFVEGPEVYEYPSESSLLIEEIQTSPVAQIRSVPSLSGSSLANYTPKGTEEFQPGVTRSVQNVSSKAENIDTSDVIPQEVEQPIMFSSRTNTDILF